MDWQPIDTAPKDGSMVLVSGGYPYVANWHMGGWLYAEYSGSSVYISEELTHWMPLPEPPSDR